MARHETEMYLQREGEEGVMEKQREWGAGACKCAGLLTQVRLTAESQMLPEAPFVSVQLLNTATRWLEESSTARWH